MRVGKRFESVVHVTFGTFVDVNDDDRILVTKTLHEAYHLLGRFVAQDKKSDPDYFHVDMIG